MAATGATVVSGIAERYALALLDLADEKKELDSVADDLRGLQKILEESDDLRRLIRSPMFDREQQTAAMSSIIEKAGFGELTRRFVLIVARNRRLFALPQMITAYLAELARRRGEVTAEVATARALSEAQEAALAQSLKSMLGGKVKVASKVEPDLIGGMVVRVGSRMYDSSLRTKLQKLQLAMKGVA